MRPIPNAGDIAVLDRIEVNVIEVPGDIVLVAQGMFQIPPLPDPALALGGAADGDLLGRRQGAKKRS